MNLGDLSHLAPDDAALYAALYAERNDVDPRELTYVRTAATTARDLESLHAPTSKEHRAA